MRGRRRRRRQRAAWQRTRGDRPAASPAPWRGPAAGASAHPSLRYAAARPAGRGARWLSRWATATLAAGFRNRQRRIRPARPAIRDTCTRHVQFTTARGATAPRWRPTWHISLPTPRAPPGRRHPTACSPDKAIATTASLNDMVRCRRNLIVTGGVARPAVAGEQGRGAGERDAGGGVTATALFLRPLRVWGGRSGRQPWGDGTRHSPLHVLTRRSLPPPPPLALSGRAHCPCCLPPRPVSGPAPPRCRA
jgi:hypothetical protein